MSDKVKEKEEVNLHLHINTDEVDLDNISNFDELIEKSEIIKSR